MKALMFVAAAVIVIGGLLLGGRAYMNRTRAAEATTLPTAKVVRGDIRVAVAATGSVISNLDVDIKCKASGTVVSLPFDVSDKVKKGDQLLKLDPIDQQHIVDQAQAALTASRAQLATAQQNLKISEANLVTSRIRANSNMASAQTHLTDMAARADRMKQLLDKKLAAQEDYDAANTAAVQSQTDLHNAEAAVADLQTQDLALEVQRQAINMAQAQVMADTVRQEIAQQGMKDTTVFAPMDGVVASRATNMQIGYIISSAITNTGGGTTVMTLSDLSRIFIDASVDESDIGRVKVGQAVEVTADSFPGTHFDGKVIQIATRGVNASNVVTFDVKIEIMSKNMDLLKPVMTGNVSIIVSEQKESLMVPSQAVTRKGKESEVTVVNADGTTQIKTVEVGITDGENRQIVSGLEEGQVVQVHPGPGDSRWRADPNANSNNNSNARAQRMMTNTATGGGRGR